MISELLEYLRERLRVASLGHENWVEEGKGIKKGSGHEMGLCQV